MSHEALANWIVEADKVLTINKEWFDRLKKDMEFNKPIDKFHHTKKRSI